MEAEEAPDPPQPEQGQQGIGAKAPIGQSQIAGLKLGEKFLQQSQLVLVLVALGVIEQSPRAQAEDADQFQEREAAAGLLAAGLRIGALVFWGVGQAGAGAINHFDRQTAPELAGFLGLGRRGATQARQPVPGHPGARLTVGAGAGVNLAAAQEGQEGLDLADDFATGAIGVEHLIEKAEEGAADAKDPLPAIGPCLGLGQKLRRQERAQE